jgi:hypothetical protein
MKKVVVSLSSIEVVEDGKMDRDPNSFYITSTEIFSKPFCDFILATISRVTSY